MPPKKVWKKGILGIYMERRGRHRKNPGYGPVYYIIYSYVRDINCVKCNIDSLSARHDYSRFQSVLLAGEITVIGNANVWSQVKQI